MTRAEQAREYFLNGETCAQSVLLSFSDVTGLDEETARKISLPFGGGLGRMRLTCGAFSGIAMVVGMVFSKPYPDLENKKQVYEMVQELAKRFKERVGSIMCGQILTNAGVSTNTSPSPEKRTAEYLQKRPCPNICYLSAEILEEYLKELNVI